MFQNYCYVCGVRATPVLALLAPPHKIKTNFKRAESYTLVGSYREIPIYTYTHMPQDEIYFISKANLFLVKDLEIFEHRSKTVVCEMLLTKYKEKTKQP